jgi:hypothetical protein
MVDIVTVANEGPTVGADFPLVQEGKIENLGRKVMMFMNGWESPTVSLRLVGESEGDLLESGGQ